MSLRKSDFSPIHTRNLFQWTSIGFFPHLHRLEFEEEEGKKKKRRKVISGQIEIKSSLKSVVTLKLFYWNDISEKDYTELW